MKRSRGYKPNTDVVEESPGLLLAHRLVADGVDVVAYDSAGMPSARRGTTEIRYSESAEQAVRESDVVVIATAWQEFASLEQAVFARNPRRVGDRLVAARRVGRSGPRNDYVALGTADPGLREAVAC